MKSQLLLLHHVFVSEVYLSGSSPLPDIRDGLIILHHHSIHLLISKDMWLKEPNLVKHVDVTNHCLHLLTFKGGASSLKPLLKRLLCKRAPCSLTIEGPLSKEYATTILLPFILEVVFIILLLQELNRFFTLEFTIVDLLSIFEVECHLSGPLAGSLLQCRIVEYAISVRVVSE